MHAQRYLLLLALIASSAHAVEVTLASRPGINTDAIAVHATRVDRPVDPVDAVMRTGVANALALPEGVWELSVTSEAIWAPRVYARANDTVTIPLWPAVAIRAKAKDVAQLSVAFTPLDDGGAAGRRAASPAIRGRASYRAADSIYASRRAAPLPNIASMSRSQPPNRTHCNSSRAHRSRDASKCRAARKSLSTGSSSP